MHRSKKKYYEGLLSNKKKCTKCQTNKNKNCELFPFHFVKIKFGVKLHSVDINKIEYFEKKKLSSNQNKKNRWKNHNEINIETNPFSTPIIQTA